MMNSELVLDDGKPWFLHYRAVAVKDYGSEGCLPIYEDDCPYKGEISCVSGSGGSACGGFFGHAGLHAIKCTFKLEEK